MLSQRRRSTELHRLDETDIATVTGGDLGEHFVHGRALSKAAKRAGQVLLQRLPVLICAGLQLQVDFLRHVPNQYVWHPRRDHF